MNTDFVKNITIAGFPGGGKISVMVYIVIYARSKGLTLITVDMMYHREIKIGGLHWHKFYACLFIVVTTCLSTKLQNLPFINYNVFQIELRSFGVFI